MAFITTAGGTCIDFKNTPADPNSFGPSLGGDAALNNVRLNIAMEHGWAVAGAQLVTLVGRGDPVGWAETNAKYNLAPLGCGWEEFVMRGLRGDNQNPDAQVLNPNLIHDGPARFAVWEIVQGGGLVVEANNAGQPTDLYLKIPQARPTGKDIILLASAATTAAFDDIGHHLAPALNDNALMILSPNTRNLATDEYNEKLSRQKDKSHLVVVSRSDIIKMYPGSSEEDALTMLKGDVVHRRRRVLMVTRGETGIDFYQPGQQQPVHMDSLRLPGVRDSVGAGGGALTGAILAFAELGVHSLNDLLAMRPNDFKLVGGTAAIFAAYHLASQNAALKSKMKFPQPQRVVNGFIGSKLELTA